MKILYIDDTKDEEGTFFIIHPTLEWGGTIEQLAQKDVPTGQKYKIVEDSYLPTDRSFRGAWEIDEAELTDGVGA